MTTRIKITDKMVEAGCIALDEYLVKTKRSSLKWPDMNDEERDEIRGAIRVAIEAARDAARPNFGIKK